MKFTANQPFVLASASPRRKELLDMLGFAFEIEPSPKEEPNPEEFNSAVDYVRACAALKAADIAEKHPQAAVIGSDTVVVLDGEVLRKPKNKGEARSSLRKLSGKTHEVITAVHILHGTFELPFHEITKVTFYELPEEWIEAYIETPDPYDKAGAYGIQTLSGLFVKGIDGEYHTVVGLPIGALTQKLAQAGLISLERSHVEC